MKTKQILAGIALVWAVGTSSGQELNSSPQPAAALGDDPTIWSEPGSPPWRVGAGQFWAEANYVLYWLKPVCYTVPGVTIGNPNDTVPGAVGQPGTQVVEGDHKFQFGGANGIRTRMGAWLTDDQLVGVELEGFVLEQVASGQSVTANASSPPLFLPFQNPDNSQGLLPFSIPGVVGASSNSVGTSRMWGLEANVPLHFAVEQGAWILHATALAGVRYLDLADRVLVTNTQYLISDPSVAALGQANFSTRNQFVGGQVGSRLGVEWGQLRLDLTTKLALGETHLVSDVNGSTLLSGSSVLPGLLPGPFLALPSNIGRSASERITVVPEFNLSMRWQVTDSVYLRLGYDLLYWNKILCPGDQMNPHVNATALPYHGPLVGLPAPTPQFVFTDAFLQGLEAGFGVNF